MGMAIYWLGAIVALVGVIWMIINAFKTSILWGLGSLFIPFVVLIFAAMHWAQNKQPFLIWLGGVVIAIVGALMGGMGAMGAAVPAPTL